MGLITSIRKRLWIVTILIAVALLGFLIMDVTTGKGSLFGNDDTLGSIAGEKVHYKDFQKTEGVLYQNTDVDFFGRREYLWNQYVEKAILDKEAANNGTGVSELEMQELEFGNFLSPVIQRNFRNPTTGQVNREQLNQFKAGLDNETLPQQLKEFWVVQKKEIEKDRMYTKLNNIVSKSLHMPNFMIERNQVESNTRYTLLATRIPYTAIKDEEVEVKEEDYLAYLKENAGSYQNTEDTKSLKYALIDISATATDSAAIRKILEDKVEKFKSSTNDSLFVTTNLGKWDEVYYTGEKLDPINGGLLMSTVKGEIAGPYVEKGEYRLAKVLDKKMIPDSVKSRHILRRVSTQSQLFAAKKLLDSLQNLLVTGKARFDSLAIQFSEDPGSAIKGGDLGFAAENMMVKPFNDAIFFKLGVGKSDLVFSDFGVHLVQVTDQKFISKKEGVKLAIIAETIQPGDEEINARLDEAQGLIQNAKDLTSLEKAIDDGGKYKMELVGNVTENTFKINKIGEKGNQVAREFVRWAYQKGVKPGDVCPEVYSLQDPDKHFLNQYMIGGLVSENPKGLMTVAAAKNFIETTVKNKKKFEKIKSKVGDVVNIDGNYGEYNVKVDTLNEISILGAQLPQFGDEPEILAKIGKLEKDKVVGLIEGKGGAYVLKLLDVKEPSPTSNLDAFRRFYQHPAKGAAMNYLMASLKKNTNIKDNRSKFY
ncbi:MAG TPA: peptidylprolyl isomerase [Saprospiraceae bacterium]|nr:peptidylprolyl isomerase [Saprospiraceae bacterium]